MRAGAAVVGIDSGVPSDELWLELERARATNRR
jgi:hypothetical protein